MQSTTILVLNILIAIGAAYMFFALRRIGKKQEDDTVFFLGANILSIIKGISLGLFAMMLVIGGWQLSEMKFFKLSDTFSGLFASGPDPAELAAAAVVFEKNCSSCHGSSGEGGIGPNLTDNYFIHGPEKENISNVIINGVLEKGMAPWGTILPKEDIPKLVNYIISLRGTNPENPKPPQGEKYAFENGEPTLIPGEAITENIITIPDDVKKIEIGGDIEKGQTLFNGILGCAHCHGTNGHGHVDNRNVRGMESRYGGDYDRMIDYVMLKGRKGTAMPPWDHLSDQKLIDIKSFLVSIQQ